MPSFNDFETTEDLLAAWKMEDEEEWHRIDQYSVSGKTMLLYKSTFGRYQIIRDWINGETSSFTFQDVDRAMEVFDANQRLMDRKWFAKEPPPANWARF